MKRNAQILLSLALTLAMCLGLCIPAAATVSSLDSQTAKAYLTVLTEQINQYGTASGYDGMGISDSGAGIQYAALEDMNGNGTPELLMLRYKDSQTVNVGIWTMKNGTASRTVNYDILSPTTLDISLSWTKKSGQYCVCWVTGTPYETFGELIYANGTIEEDSVATDPAGYGSPLDSMWGGKVSIETKIISGGGMTWFYDEKLASNVSSMKAELSKRVSQTTSANGYAPFTLTFNDYIFVFERAKVAKDITVTMCYDGGPEDDDWYEKEQGKLVEVQPGSQVTVYQGSKSNPVEYGEVIEGSIGSDGIYYPMVSGLEAIYSGVIEEPFWRTGIFFHFPSENSSENYFVVLGSNSTTATVSGFTDVKASDYYADAVKWAVDKGITSGTTATTFSPNSTCTNVQILTFLWRAYGSPEPTISNPFSNIKPSDYYYKAALWAKEKGLVSGSTFNASGPCTRATTVTYMWKAAGSPSTSSKTSFTDVSSTASYAKAVAWAVSRGITSGTSATTFSPSQTCTRGQIMTFLYRDLA